MVSLLTTAQSVIGTAALNSNGQDLLFYTQSDGTISFWSNRNSNEGTDQDKYTSQDVIINTNSVTADPSVPLIAAVAYLDPEQSTHEVHPEFLFPSFTQANSHSNHEPSSPKPLNSLPLACPPMLTFH